jgi:hypothetical protein
MGSREASVRTVIDARVPSSTVLSLSLALALFAKLADVVLLEHAGGFVRVAHVVKQLRRVDSGSLLL